MSSLVGKCFGVLGAFLVLSLTLTASGAHTYADSIDCEATPEEPLCQGIEEASKRYGGCDSNPFPYLETHHGGDRSNSFVTPTEDGKRGIDTALACRLKKLLEFADSKGCRLTITSAMRPTQKCNPTGGACASQGNSCHQYGRAVDLGGSSQCLAWLTSVIGRQNPRSPFKLHVAYLENANYRHIQCTEHLVANASAAGGCRSACTGGISIDPEDLSNIRGPGSTPSSGIADRFRNMLNPQSAGGQAQQGGQSEQQLCSLPSGGTVPCSAIANSGANTQGSQQQALPSTQQPLQNLQEPTPISNILSSSKDTKANTTQTNKSTSSKNAIDQILLLADFGSGTKTEGNATKDPPILIVGDENAIRLETPTRNTNDSLTIENDLDQNAPKAQQTFTSEDLQQSQPSEELSTVQKILATAKQLLMRILAYLKPFGRPTSVSEGAEYFAE